MLLNFALLHRQVPCPALTVGAGEPLAFALAARRAGDNIKYSYRLRHGLRYYNSRRIEQLAYEPRQAR